MGGIQDRCRFFEKGHVADVGDRPDHPRSSFANANRLTRDVVAIKLTISKRQVGYNDHRRVSIASGAEVAS
jgi:hypothetical protein